MEYASTIALGFAPGLFWLWYFRRKDDFEPEPPRLVVAAFLLGCLTPFAVLALRPDFEDLLPKEIGRHRDLIDAFLVTALLEESIKLLAFVLVAVLLHDELDEPLDGIIYGIAVALGFASVENVLYLQRHPEATLVLYRAFTATLCHVACSGCLCFLFVLSRFVRWRGRSLLALGGLVLAVGVHGTYDYFLFAEPRYSKLALLFVLPLVLLLLGLKIRWARKRSPDFHPDLPRSGQP